MIGSAASAVQFVPEIAKEVGQLHLFQRAANWVLPKIDTPYTEEEIEHFRTHPEAVLAKRQEIFDSVDPRITFADPAMVEMQTEIGLEAIEVVEDPEVRRKLTPTVPYGCQRPLISNYYYPTFNRPNVELVTDPIERITETGIVTADGVERECDTIVYATGFKTTRVPRRPSTSPAAAGRRIADAWSDGAHAYLGITTAGLPQPVHALRAQHQQRLDHLHDRGPGGVRGAAPPVDGPRRPGLDRRAARGRGRVQRRAPGRHGHGSARGPPATATTTTGRAGRSSPSGPTR